MIRKIITIDSERCNGCGQCLAKCPQGLNVPEQLKKVAETFGF
mgnify:FL=1